MPLDIALEIIVGAVLGFAVGLTGTGGAGLAIPGLVLLLGFSTVTAVATTFPFAAIIKLVGFIQHRKQGAVHLKVGVALLLGGVPGSILGVLALSQLFDAHGEDLDLWLNMVIGGLIIVGMVMLLGKTRAIEPRPGLDDPPFGRREWMTGSALGGIFGLIMGATSVGAGSLMIPPLVLIYRLRAAAAVGTTIGVSVVLMLVGTVGHLGTGLIDWSAVLFLSSGAIPTVVLGSTLTRRISERVLVKAVVTVMMVAGIALIVKGVLLI